jgi:hypothetical protein
MSSSHCEKILFTSKLRLRLPAGEFRDHPKLFLLSDSEWTLENQTRRRFTGQNLEAQIPSKAQILLEAQIPSRRTCTTLFKGIFRRFSKQAPPDSELCIPTSQGPKAPLPAFKATHVHNCTCSSFHNLPVELILEIADCLPPVARLAMQRVCSKFRTNLTLRGTAPELGDGVLTVGQAFQFVFLLRRDKELRLQDDYDQKCNLPLLNSTLDRLGCSGCRTTHEIENFSAKQLSLPPKARICKGLEASFPLCEHLSFSGQCLLRGVRELYCELGHHHDIHGNYMRGIGLQETPHFGFHGGHIITIDRIVPLLVIGESDRTTHDLLSSALRRRDAYICPHLRSSSLELFDGRSMTAECSDYTFSEIREDTYKAPCRYQLRPCHQLRRGQCVAWSQCPSQDCFTRYCLNRIWTGRYHGIILEVSCDLFGGPTHPSWQSQIPPKGEITKVGGHRINKPKHSEANSIRTSNLSTSMNTSKKSKTNTARGVRFKCSARFESCKGECCLAKYNTFMNA